MVYRPTVRYDDLYKEYVDLVFIATSLDRNQIIRLALFAAPFSPLFQHQLKKHMTSSLPPASWEVVDHGLWMEQSYEKREERRDVINGDKKEICIIEDQPEKSEGSEREVFTQRRLFKQQGGITFKVG